MLANDYLYLRLARLVPSEAPWVVKGPGLFFLFARSGAGKLITARGAHHFSSEDVVLVNLNTGETISTTGDSSLVFNYFTLSFEHLLPLFAAKEMFLLDPVWDSFKAVKIYPRASTLAFECHRLLKDVSPEFDLSHRGQLLRIVSSIISFELKQLPNHKIGWGNAMEHITHVFEQLSVTEIFRMSIEELAGKFGCSSRHLNRLFHQYFGFSVAALRMEMRMLKAVSLLRDPRAKILDIADQCGFNHLSLFNDCFKKRFGMTPGQWRKSRSSEDGNHGGTGKSGLGCPLRNNGLCPWNETEGVDGGPALNAGSNNVALIACADATGVLAKAKNKAPSIAFGSQNASTGEV